MNPKTRQCLALLLAGCFLVVMLTLVGAVYLAAHVSLEAESTLHALDLVYDAVGKFLENNGGTWPKSWEQLATNLPNQSASPPLSPDQIERLRRRVRINFDLTTAQVAAQDEEHFSAIGPIGPYYAPFRETIRRLLTIARRFTGKANGPEAGHSLSGKGSTLKAGGRKPYESRSILWASTQKR